MATRNTSAQAKQVAQHAALTSGNPRAKKAPVATPPAAPQAASPNMLEQIQALRIAFPQMSAGDIATLVAQANGQAAPVAVQAPAPVPATPKAPTHGAENMTFKLNGNKLTIEIDLDVVLRVSGSGKSNLIASTGSAPFKVPGTDVSLGLNLYRPIEKALRKLTGKASK